MSYTTIYKIDTDGDVIEYADIKEAHRIALTIWQLIHIRWFKLIENCIERPEWVKEGETVTFSDIQVSGQMSDFWPLYRNLSVSRAHRIVFGSTFDYMTVKAADFEELINAYELFMKDLDFCSELEDFGGMEEFVRIIKELQSDTDCKGLSMCSSVISSLWENYDDVGEYSAYNTNKDTRHWDLFEDTNLKEETKRQTS